MNGIIYAVGGGADGGIHEAYDPMSATWTTKTSMLTGRSGTSAGVINGKLYVVGGHYTEYDNYYGVPLNVGQGTLEVYDPVTDMWIRQVPMTFRRWDSAAAVINNKLYVVGGGYTGALEAFTPP